MLRRRPHILLDEDRYRRVAAEASARGVSVARVIREAIDALLPADRGRRARAARRVLAAPRCRCPIRMSSGGSWTRQEQGGGAHPRPPAEGDAPPPGVRQRVEHGGPRLYLSLPAGTSPALAASRSRERVRCRSHVNHRNIPKKRTARAIPSPTTDSPVSTAHSQ